MSQNKGLLSYLGHSGSGHECGELSDFQLFRGGHTWRCFEGHECSCGEGTYGVVSKAMNES